jgi:micrococcal nuclease
MVPIMLENGPEPCYRYRATVRRVLDGDTYLLDVDLGFRIFVALNIRVHRYDAPEMFTPEGHAAKMRAEGLLQEAKQIVIESYKDARSFERWVADVYIDGVPIGERLSAEGFVK